MTDECTFNYPHLCFLYSLCSLDLDKWIYDPPRESDDDFKDSLGFVLDPSSSPGLKGDKSPTMGKGKKHKRTKAEKEEEVEMEKVCVCVFVCVKCVCVCV